MKKFIGLTAISLALGAATLSPVASAQWGWDDFGDDDTTVVVRTGDRGDCDWGGRRCGFNRCNRCNRFNRCGWNRCGFNRCGFGGWNGGWNGGWDNDWYF